MTCAMLQAHQEVKRRREALLRAQQALQEASEELAQLVVTERRQGFRRIPVQTEDER